MNLARLALNCCCNLRARVIILEEGAGAGSGISEWEVGSAFSAGDVVYYLGDLYVADSDTTGDDPSSGSPWTLIVSGGTVGPTGPTGATGATGGTSIGITLAISSGNFIP